MTYRWTEGQNRQLIRLVQERPCLWYKNDPAHSNKQVKDASWADIDSQLGTDGAYRRFKSLRDDFTRFTKGTRKEYTYAGDLAFLRGEIGHRSSNNRSRSSSRTRAKRSSNNNSLPADTTIELLDESDEESVGLYEGEDQQDQQEVLQQPINNTRNSLRITHIPSSLFAHQQQQLFGNYNFQEVAAAAQAASMAKDESQDRSDGAKRPRIDTPCSSAQDSIDWQAPVDNSTISREDYQYCKTIISAMSPLPAAKQRKLKSQIYNLITEAVNNYEAERY